jgi:hypothetical protein
MSKKNKSKSKQTSKAAKKSDPDLVPLNEAMKPKNGKAKTKAPKPAMEKKPKKLSCLDAAAQVLKAKSEPMNCKGMIDAMFAGKLWHSDAPTPAATLYSAILREVQNKKGGARFKKTDRGLFAFNG